MLLRLAVVFLAVVGILCAQPRLMPADSDPAFEVLTIKPHNPAVQGFGLGYDGRQFYATNTSLRDLIALAYSLHSSQISGGPSWAENAKFDMRGTADVEGQPGAEQLRIMVRKLLGERFQLAFHRDTKELSVYTIVSAKAGPKFLDHEGDPVGRPTFGFQALGSMVVKNASIADFAGWMQRYVMDRPVVDRSAISGRYDFQLNWTPDDSQFGDRAVQLPSQTGNVEHVDLYTAMQQQLGLKLESRRVPVPLFVIDRVERPPEN